MFSITVGIAQCQPEIRGLVSMFGRSSLDTCVRMTCICLFSSSLHPPMCLSIHHQMSLVNRPSNDYDFCYTTVSPYYLGNLYKIDQK